MYKLYFYTFLVCSLLYLMALPVVAQQKPLAIERTSVTNKTKRGIIPSPVVYYTPNTEFAFGASLTGYLKLRSKSDTIATRLSTARFFTDFTTNKQMQQLLAWNIFTRNEKLLLRGEINHRIFRDRFFGIGNDTPDEAEEVFRYSFVSVRLTPMKNIGRRVFIGPDIQVADYYDTKLNPADGKLESQLLTGEIPGYQGGLNVGIGAVVVNDNRDNVAFPSSGHYLEVSAHRFGDPFGGDFEYNKFYLSASKYIAHKPDHVLAGNVVLNLNNGEVPVQRLATVGGEQILRGYTRNRFFNNNFAGLQAEYRFPLFWRLGMVAFAGAGDVFDRINDTSFSSLKYALGTGLRLRLLPEEKLNSRLDIGYGREGFAVFVGLGEAF
jgi:hypothetical protein